MIASLLGTLMVMIGGIGSIGGPDIVYAAPEEPEEVLQPFIEVAPESEEDRIIRLIKETFPEDPETAVAVAKGESGPALDPTAYNPEWHYDRNGNKVCQGSYGVMQVACVHMKENPRALFDLEVNLDTARKIHDESGWSPWGAYTSGRYLRYI